MLKTIKSITVVAAALLVISCSDKKDTGSLYSKGASCLDSCETVLLPSSLTSGKKRPPATRIYKYCNSLYLTYFDHPPELSGQENRAEREKITAQSKLAYGQWEDQNRCQHYYRELFRLGEKPSIDYLENSCDKICNGANEPEESEESDSSE